MCASRCFQKQNAKVGSGKLQSLSVTRKREWANPKSNRCPFVFFLQSGDSPQRICDTRTNCQLNVIRNSLKDSGKRWHVRDQALNATGCCTTTTPHVTRQSPSMNVWQEKYSCGSSAPIFDGSQSLWIRFIPPAQKPLERLPFWYFG